MLAILLSLRRKAQDSCLGHLVASWIGPRPPFQALHTKGRSIRNDPEVGVS